MSVSQLHSFWPLGNNGINLSGSTAISSFNGSATTVQRGPFADKGSRLISGGTSDYIDCGQNNSIREKATFSFWIKWVNFQTGADGGYAHNIISRRDPSSVDGTYNVYYIDSRGGTPANTINVAFRDSSTFRLKRSATLPTLTEDRWYHFAIVVDFRTAGGTFFYLDGKQIGTSADDVQTAAWTVTPGSTNTRIGYSSNAGSNFNGYISQFIILGRQMTANEIRAYYNYCTQPPKPRVLMQEPYAGISRIITETAYAADAIEAYQSTKWPAVTETAIAADTIAIRNTYHHPVITETAYASDTVDPYVVSTNRHITETALAADAIAARVSTFWPAVTEEAIAADTVATNFTFFRYLDEAALASDEVIGRIPKEVEITEAATASDLLLFQHTYVSTSKSGIYKLYLNSVIRTTLFQKYRQDYDCTEKVFAAPERQEYTVWQTIRQNYRQYYGMEMEHIPCSARQNYDLTSMAIFRRNWNGGLQAFAYNIRVPFTFQSRQYENITERTRVDLRQRVYYTARENDDYTENVSYIYKVMLDGLDYTDKVKSLSYNYSLSQYTGECSITWADPQMYAQLDPLTNMGSVRVEVYTGHYGGALVLQGRFLIEKRSTEIDVSKAYPTTWGRTITARLASPHSLPITKTWMNDTKALTIALEVMQLSDPTITLNWQVTDYDVLGGNFVAAGDEPISLLTKLAEPLGAIVTTNKQGQVVVRYQYV